MSNISYKTYIGKTIICRTLSMSIIIMVLYSCMIATSMCICTEVSKNSRFSAVYAQRIQSHMARPFIVRGVYHLQYKHPAKALSMVIMLHSYLYVLNYLAGSAHNCMQHMLHSSSYYFHLKLWTEQLQLKLLVATTQRV